MILNSTPKIITGGGGTTPGAPGDITFYDYDGTIVTSWTLEELTAKTALPDYPSHEGLICQGWNWSLADLKTTNRKMNVGAMYITDDGKTRVYIRLEEGRTSPMLGVCPNGTVTVDWGDGTTPDTLTGTSTSTVKWTPNHAYAAAGEYVIKLTVDGTMGFHTDSSANNSTILRYSSDSDNRNYVYLNSVQKIEIGSGVTSIGNYAFRNCASLASIMIPNSLTSIGMGAIHSCPSLSSITIPNSVTSIGDYAIRYCYSLSSIAIPNSVINIGKYAFHSCYSLSSITIPDSLTSIEEGTFGLCFSLASITISNSVTSIGEVAFQNCNSLSSIIIPDSLTSIGNAAFQNCFSIVSITIPNGVTSIGNNSFENCTSIASITIPNGVTSIGNNEFRSCFSMVSITIPNGVTSIKQYAFQGCRSLSSITMPDSLMSIEDGTFANCSGIAFYDFTACTAVPTLSDRYVFENISADCQIRVPANLWEDWKSATNWSTYANYLVPIGLYVYPAPARLISLYNKTVSVTIKLLNCTETPVVTAVSSNTSVATILDIQPTLDEVTVLVSTLETEGISEITINITVGSNTVERSSSIQVYESYPETTVTVVGIEGASYGFALNDAGYYESQNKGVNSSYALCRVNISNVANRKLYFDCINSGEANYDYGLLGAVNQELAKSNTADAGVKQSFRGKSSTSVQTVEYDDATGNCFIDVKFIKDSGGNSGNDSLQFKVRVEETT